MQPNGKIKHKKGAKAEVKADARYKVIVLGEATVGKTSLIHAALGEKFDPTLISTIGVDFAKRTFQVEGYTIQLELWDTAGQERFRSISSMHFRDAKGFIIVYDITNRETFNRIRKDWITSIDKNAAEQAPVFFVGNKVDLEATREVSFEEGQKLAYQQCSNLHIETSAKTGHNVDQLFYTVAETMISYFGAPKRYYEMDHKTDLVELRPMRQANANTVDLNYSKGNKPGVANKKQCCE